MGVNPHALATVHVQVIYLTFLLTWMYSPFVFASSPLDCAVNFWVLWAGPDLCREQDTHSTENKDNTRLVKYLFQFSLSRGSRVYYKYNISTNIFTHMKFISSVRQIVINATQQCRCRSTWSTPYWGPHLARHVVCYLFVFVKHVQVASSKKGPGYIPGLLVNTTPIA